MKNNQIRDHSFGKNAIFLILSKVSYIGASFILYIVLVQVLDRNQINIFGLAISFNSLFIIIADFGITEVVIRSSASCPREKLSSVFLSGLILKTIYAIAWYLLLYIVIKLIYHDVIMQKAIFIACFSALIRSFSEYIEGIATGVGKSGLVAVFTLIQYSLLLFLAVMAGVVFRWGVISVLYSYVIVMFVSLIMRLIWLVRYTKLKFNTLEVLESFMVYIKESPKFGIALITATINGAHLYLIIISLIDKTSNDLAVFQGGQKILALLHILGGMVGRSFYAAASNAIVLKNDYELKKLLQKATHYLAIISFGAIVLFTVMGQEIADFIYFNNLRGAGNILVLLAFSIPFALFQYIPFAILPASGKQGIVTISLLVTGCMGWPITYYATNFWGIRGTAYAYIFLTVIQFIILFVLQNIYFGYLPEFKQLWKVVTASLVMGSILYFARGFWPVLIVCITGAMVYMIMLVLLKEIQPSCNESG